MHEHPKCVVLKSQWTFCCGESKYRTHCHFKKYHSLKKVHQIFYCFCMFLASEKLMMKWIIWILTTEISTVFFWLCPLGVDGGSHVLHLTLASACSSATPIHLHSLFCHIQKCSFWCSSLSPVWHPHVQHLSTYLFTKLPLYMCKPSECALLTLSPRHLTSTDVVLILSIILTP